MQAHGELFPRSVEARSIDQHRFPSQGSGDGELSGQGTLGYPLPLELLEVVSGLEPHQAAFEGVGARSHRCSPIERRSLDSPRRWRSFTRDSLLPIAEATSAVVRPTRSLRMRT